MGLFGFGSSSGESKAEKKARIKQQYDGQLEDLKRQLDSHKKRKTDEQWQYKMNKHSAHKDAIARENVYIKQIQARIKQVKEAKSSALKNL